MLTGIEQYHWEKAGYFIRRSLFDANAIRSWDPSDELVLESVGALIADLLGGPCDLVEAAADSHPSASWRRAEGGAYSAGSATLARQPEGVVVRIAVAPDEGLQVLPGSHVSPLSTAEMKQLGEDPAAGLSGGIRIRLAAGDTLFYSTGLLAMAQPQTERNAREVRFRKQRG